MIWINAAGFVLTYERTMSEPVIIRPPRPTDRPRISTFDRPDRSFRLHTRDLHADIAANATGAASTGPAYDRAAQHSTDNGWTDAFVEQQAERHDARQARPRRGGGSLVLPLLGIGFGVLGIL